VVILMLLVAGYLVWRALGPSEAESLASDRYFIDSKTMKPFRHNLTIGDQIPCKAPSGGQTGYPAELCYWTKDGKPKESPTPVLLNEFAGKTGPTFCPDCGRLVIAHNPLPGPNAKPPPIEAEYKARGGGGSAPSRDGRSEIRHYESRHEIRIVLR
jgi:hypothetical protein